MSSPMVIITRGPIHIIALIEDTRPMQIMAPMAEAALEKITRESLPKGAAFEWTELTYQQILSGNTALLVFPICVLLVLVENSRQ